MKRPTLCIMSVILGLSCLIPAHSQSTWAAPLQQNNYECMSELPNGDFLVLGRRRLGMINATGEVQWEKEYAQSIYECKPAGDTTVFVTGQDEKNNFWAAEIGIHGSILWEKSMPHIWGSGTSIKVAPSGNVVFAGNTWMSNSVNSESISSIELIDDTTLAFLGSDGNPYTWFRKSRWETNYKFYE